MTFILRCGLAAFLAFSVASAAQAHTHASTTAVAKAPALQTALRGLWRGHVEQTRAYALAVHAGDAKAAANAEAGVVANAHKLSDAVAGFYGKAAGERMFALLAGHWGAVKAMTDAARRGDTDAGTRATTALTANAHEIAAFLAGANPNLPEDAVFGLLAAHGAHHAAQIGQIMRGDMTSEAVTWKAMRQHMDAIADALAGAISKQFPEKVG